MSYILDALRKSQQARQPGPGAGPRGAVHNITLTLPASGWWLAIGIILLIGILGAALIFWRSTAGTVSNIPAAPPAATPPVTTVAPALVAAEKAPPPENPVKNPAPVRDLAEEARVPVHVLPKKSSAVRPPRKKAASRHPAPSSSVMALPIAPDDTPLLQQLPLDFQRALPPMVVTIHVYSHEESQRILFINNREYHKGDQIEGKVRVEEIVPDGVVLSYRGERFKLSRPR